MKTKALSGVVIVLVVGILAAVLDPTRVLMGTLRGESFFEGRPSSYWSKMLEGDNPAALADALQQLEQGDENAVAVLAEIAGNVDGTSPEQRLAAIEILGKYGQDASLAGATVLAALKDPDQHVRAVAASNVAKVGVSANDAVPALTEMLSGNQKQVVARALSEYRGDALEALPQLVQILEDKSLDSEVRWNAARTLGKLGTVGVDAIPPLLAALEDEAATVREHSAEALGDIGPPAAETVPNLIAVLDDEAPRVRKDAARSLGQIGAPSRVAIPELTKLLDDPEEIVRSAARTALETIAPEVLAARKEQAKEEP